MVGKEELEDSFEEYLSEDDSDEELQKAFQKGQLKPGVNVVQHAVSFINDVGGMQEAVDELNTNLDWIETLALTNEPAPATDATCAPSDEEDEDMVHHDFKRELFFYRVAQASVLNGIPRLHQLGIKTKRPEDYFAQMAKSDDHMKKVRVKLLSKQHAMERSEKAKKIRELRKFGKKVQTEVLQKRQKEKREMLEAVKKYRKGEKDKLDFLENDKKKIKKENPKKENPKQGPGKKRAYKNLKFGHGGQKKRSKSNTKSSADDVSGFNVKTHASRPGKKSQKQSRPGKARRQKNKSKSK